MSAADDREGARRIRRFVGVYDADGSLRGELAYWVGARLGRAHCALCDITHGLARKSVGWKACRAGLPVPFDTYHRDDRPASVAAVTDRLPVVVAETDDGTVLVLLTADALDACGGSGPKLVSAMEEAVAAHGLDGPVPEST